MSRNNSRAVSIQSNLHNRRPGGCGSVHGFSLISLAALVLISGVFISALLIQSNSTRRREIQAVDRSLAQVYAAEIAEYFRSFQTGTALVAFLAGHTAAQNGGTPYRFCEDINFLNRTTATLVRPDALAALPPNRLDLADAGGKANRWYQIQIQDVTGPKPVTNTAKCGPFTAATVLAPGEKVVVTVRVAWLTPVKREVLTANLSTVLPE